MTTIAAGNERRAQRKAFDGAANGDAFFGAAESAADLFRHIDKTNEPDFVNFSGENVGRRTHGSMIGFRCRNWDRENGPQNNTTSGRDWGPSTLFGFCAGNGGGDAEGDERAAGDVFLNAEPAEIGTKPVGEGTGEHGPGTVAQQTQQSERAAEEEDLCGDVSARGVHELGEEGEEEESGFGIEKVDEDSLTENAGEAVGHGRRDDVSVCAA